MTLKEKLMSRVCREELFSQFSYNKSASKFTLNNGFRRFVVDFGFFMVKYDSVAVRILMGVKYPILSKWFGKYSKKSVSDQRDNHNTFKGVDFYQATGNHYKYFDIYNDKDFDEQYTMIRDVLYTEIPKYFQDYTTLRKLYEKEVAPFLEMEHIEKDEYFLGLDYITENLVLCKIVAPENYNQLKKLMLELIERRKKTNEINTTQYLPELPAIFADLESTDFNAIMKKKGWSID